MRFSRKVLEGPRYLLTPAFLFFVLSTAAQFTTWTVAPAVQLIDGNSGVYSSISPGDTILLQSGNRDKLLIRNLAGSPGKPIIIMNNGGVVQINTGHYYGVSISNCRYIRFSGQGDSAVFYGIRIERVGAGAGIGIGSMSSDIELDHLLIEHCLTAGIYAKTDPDCSFLATREKFTQFNTTIHDNSIAYTGNEGLYIGSSFYAGVNLNCNGRDSLVFPPLLNGVSVYNNKVSHTGWDAIQVSSASTGCAIYGNNIQYDSEAESESQMSGIIMGGGSKCDCYNNSISNGKGDGIEDHGLGGNRIYNNIIVDAGRSFLPANPAKMKHGIFVSDISVQKDSAFTIVFNTIIHPKSDGIRFQSIKSRNNLVASNLVTEPGNYTLYGQGNTLFGSKDAYVMVPSPLSDLYLRNNYFTNSISSAGIEADYTIKPGSPLINQGYQLNLGITGDYRHVRRPCGDWFDIGAMEYESGADTFALVPSFPPVLYPNPVSSAATIRFLSRANTVTSIMIYSSSGQLLRSISIQFSFPGIRDSQLPVSQLAAGVYIYSVSNGTETHFGKFIKY